MATSIEAIAAKFGIVPGAPWRRLDREALRQLQLAVLEHQCPFQFEPGDSDAVRAVIGSELAFARRQVVHAPPGHPGTRFANLA